MEYTCIVVTVETNVYKGEIAMAILLPAICAAMMGGIIWAMIKMKPDVKM